jgi:hypothetical protein
VFADIPVGSAPVVVKYTWSPTCRPCAVALTTAGEAIVTVMVPKTGATIPNRVGYVARDTAEPSQESQPEGTP